MKGAEPLLHRLPAPHDRVEFRINAYCLDPMKVQCIVEYLADAADLVAANIVTQESLKGRISGQVTTRGVLMRRDEAGGRIILRFLKYGLVVEFVDALERGLTLPGVTDEILTAAKAKAIANSKRDFCRINGRPAAVEADRQRPSYLRLVIDNGNPVRP